MTMTLKQQAWQSGLVLSDERVEWDENDWPPLEGGARDFHASVVLDHRDNKDDNRNHKGQTVVVMGGNQQGQGPTSSVLVLNLSESNKQWREGPTMNKSREEHAAVVCNGGIYVMGGWNRENPVLDCMERMDANNLLKSLSTTRSTHESHWTTLTCRLSTRRCGCCAVAVNNQYIVVLGGWNSHWLSSVEIIDTSNHTVTAGPSMNVPRSFCASAVAGHRIFVVGGYNEGAFLDSVEYLDYATPCDNEDTKEESGSTFISFSSTWITHSEVVLSRARSSCAVVTVGSCLVVAGGVANQTVDVLDTNRNCVWNLPLLGNKSRDGCSAVTLADQMAVIGGMGNPSSATLPLMDKNTWCFRQLCQQPWIEWYHCHERSGNGDPAPSRRRLLND